MSNTFYATDGRVGVDLLHTSTTQLFPLGTKVRGSLGTEWVYVKATTAIAANDCVAYSAAWAADSATATAVATGSIVGFAQNAFAASDYGWIAIRGDALSVRVSATSTAAVQIYVATTTGSLSTTSSSGTLEGVYIATGVSTTATVTLNTCIVTVPKYRVL